MKKVKLVIRLFILFVFYPIFYYLDRHVVPVQNVFWHNYAQDLVMPRLLFFPFANIGQYMNGNRWKFKWILMLAGLEFIFGVQVEFGQVASTVPGVVFNKWDILCYAISIIIGILIFLAARRENNERI
jgi:hypothetical protein